jgi:hypothetical protein
VYQYGYTLVDKALALRRKKPTTRQIKNPHDGTTLDDFLEAEGISEEVQAG